MRAYGVRLILVKRLEIIEKLYTSKTFSKMAGAGPAPRESRKACPSINKLTLLTTAALVLNFKLWPR